MRSPSEEFFATNNAAPIMAVPGLNIAAVSLLGEQTFPTMRRADARFVLNGSGLIAGIAPCW
jgi:hypothetical protein